MSDGKKQQTDTIREIDALADAFGSLRAEVDGVALVDWLAKVRAHAVADELEAQRLRAAPEHPLGPGLMNGHIVRTCRAITDDVEPSTLPPIPRGTYGIASEDNGNDYQPVEFGPPWGVQLIGNHDLLDAAAVLLNAMRAIAVRRRPWRTVLRRTLRTFAGPYLRLAAAEAGNMRGFEDEEFLVETYLFRRGSKRAALALLSRAAVISGASAEAAASFDAPRRA